MNNYRIFTDTDCDITPKEAKKYGFSLISMPYSIDGKEVKPYEDFDEFKYREFYDYLRNGGLPNTSAIDVLSYEKYFEPVFAAGQDILYVHFSSAMTMTFNNMNKALETLKAKYPERKFYEIDTRGITTISFAIASKVGQMYLDGKTAEEIMEWSKTEIDHFAMYFFADDLKFFKHSGRVNGLSATMGTLLGIRPIIYMSQEGKMESIGTAKGRRKAIMTLLDKMSEIGDDVESYPIYVGHTDADEIVEDVIASIKEKYPKAEIITQIVNPTAGSHCGPNGLGICFHALHR